MHILMMILYNGEDKVIMIRMRQLNYCANVDNNYMMIIMTIIMTV